MASDEKLAKRAAATRGKLAKGKAAPLDKSLKMAARAETTQAVVIDA